MLLIIPHRKTRAISNLSKEFARFGLLIVATTIVFYPKSVSAQNCELTPTFQSQIVSHIAPTTFRLANQQIIRLADIQSIGERESVHLTKLVGKTLSFAPTNSKPNRYGALAVHAFDTRNQQGPQTPSKLGWVQAKLMKSGAAVLAPDRIMPSTEETADQRTSNEHATCISLLFDLALKSSPDVVDATNIPKLSQRFGTFALIKGRPTRISKSRGRTFINFGSDWKTDTTLSISRTLAARFPKWAKTLLNLKDREVLVHGFLENRRGPLISLAHPGELKPLVEPAEKSKPNSAPKDNSQQ